MSTPKRVKQKRDDVAGAITKALTVPDDYMGYVNMVDALQEVAKAMRAKESSERVADAIRAAGERIAAAVEFLALSGLAKPLGAVVNALRTPPASAAETQP